MVTGEWLNTMSKQNIEAFTEEELTDISEININKELPHDEKVLDFIAQVKNPYCFRCGTVPVKVCFSDTGKNLETALQDFFLHIHRG